MYRKEIIPAKWKKMTEHPLLTHKDREIDAYGQVDETDLAGKIEAMCNQRESEGYRLVSVTPVISGHYSAGTNQAYGFGCTDSVILLFHREGQ